MKVFLNLLLFAGLTFVGTYSTFAQDYPFWLNDPDQKYSEYPTAIASTPGAVATVGFYEANFNVDDLSYSTFYTVPCFFCNQRENIFVNMREEGTSNTWTSTISTNNGAFNNQVNVQSTPQVDISSKGDVYVSFTYAVDAMVEDASGNTVIITNGHSSYDFAVVKFNANGAYQWHITDGGRSDEYITDLDYNEATGQLAIGAYIEGGNSFQLGNHVTNAISFPSVLGANFRYGNAFVGVYQDNGSNVGFLWAEEVKLASYSTDVVQDDRGNVFLSGIYRAETAAVTLANIPLSGQYADGSITNNYFIVKFDPTTETGVWAEAYGSFHQELEIAPDKRLRYSSLAIIPQTGELFFAFVSTGGIGALFPEFGTYVNAIDPSNGALISSMTVGNTLPATMNSIHGVQHGSPTYNPSIVADEKGVVLITGNFLLTTDATNHTALGANFEDISLGNTTLQQNMTFAASYQSSTSVGWYTAMLDLSASAVYNENLSHGYITAIPPGVFYNELPVYGIAQDLQHTNHFYHVLGFNLGKLVIDLSVNHGVVNSYDNIANNVANFDGMIMRTNAKNGQLSKRGNVTTTTTATTIPDKNKIENLVGTANKWQLSPNPVVAGQSLHWTSNVNIERVDYIRLLDMTGRVVQEWQQPKATAEGFQLILDPLITGTYLLEASGKEIQQSTMVVVK